WWFSGTPCCCGWRFSPPRHLWRRASALRNRRRVHLRGGLDFRVVSAVRRTRSEVRLKPDTTEENALRFDPDLQPDLPSGGVVERAEGRRRQVVLDLRRREAVERVVGAQANPRLPLDEGEAVLEVEIEHREGREVEDTIPRTHPVEHVVGDRVREAAVDFEN